jgi:uncharacterized membrane protein
MKNRKRARLGRAGSAAITLALSVSLAGAGCGGDDRAGSAGGAGGTGGGGGVTTADAAVTGDASDASPTDPCADSHCLNGGTCTAGADGGATCVCPAGFAGVTCASNIDDCLPNPCLNGGTCVDGVAAATCTCASAFTGKRCELPRFQPLGPNAPCQGPMVATALSADGSTVVGTCGSYAAFLWTVDGSFADLGFSSATAIASFPIAVNADGSALLSRFVRSDGTAGVLRWAKGAGTTDVLTTPASAQVVAVADAANVDLSVIVGEYFDATLPVGYELGFRNTAARGLATLAVPDQSTAGCGAFAVSADGAVVAGACYDVGGLLHASRWRVQSGGDVVLDLLDTLPASTHAYGVSGDGNVVVGYGFTGTGEHEVRFVGDGSPEDLGTLPGTASVAVAASFDGSVIVGEADQTKSPFAGFATVWDADHGLRSVADALTAAGIDLGSWTFAYANGVSADGKTIVGNGTAPDGIQRFWIARLY